MKNPHLQQYRYASVVRFDAYLSSSYSSSCLIPDWIHILTLFVSFSSLGSLIPEKCFLSSAFFYPTSIPSTTSASSATASEHFLLCRGVRRSTTQLPRHRDTLVPNYRHDESTCRGTAPEHILAAHRSRCGGRGL